MAMKILCKKDSKAHRNLITSKQHYRYLLLGIEGLLGNENPLEKVSLFPLG